jgi:hypothetical protein
MSEGKPGADPDSDLVDAPFLDDAERAESAWLLAREQDPGAPAPSPAIVRDYAELEDLLGSLPAGPPDESWHEEVLRLSATATATAAAAPRPRPCRRRHRWAAAGALAAAAVATVVVLRPRSSSPDGELEIEIRHGDLVRGDATVAAVGDHLIVRTRALGGGDLRVYRADGALVGRCPVASECTISADGTLSLEVRLDAPLQHHVILVRGVTGHISGETMNAYLDAARAASARIDTRRIEVH